MSQLANRDLDLLICLRVLLEEGNVTRAAERLRMGQPAMSVALSRLRTQFSDELLVRVGRDLELTPFARSLRAPVDRAVSLIEHVLGATEPFDPAESRRVFTFIAPDHIAAELWPAAARVLAEAPAASIEMITESFELISSDQQLLRQDYFSTPPVGDTMSESAVISRDRFVGLMDRDHPLRPPHGQAISWDVFRTLPHAVAKVGADSRSPVDLILDERGYAREPVLRVPSYLHLPGAVAGTELMTILPERVARRSAAASGTEVVELPFGPIEIVESLWWHPARQNDPGHAWFTSRLREELGV